MCAPACGGAMYFLRKTSAGRAYLQIVESCREGEQVRQQVIATLGRFEDLQASGQLERLVRSGARFAAKAMMLSAATNDAAIKIAVYRIGPALVFERLWEETGCAAVIADLAGKRGHKFTLERAVFLTVLHGFGPLAPWPLIPLRFLRFQLDDFRRGRECGREDFVHLLVR